MDGAAADSQEDLDIRPELTKDLRRGDLRGVEAPGVQDDLLLRRRMPQLRDGVGVLIVDGAAAETASDAVASLQAETGEGGLTLEGMLGTDAPEEGMVERIALRESIDQLPEKERMTILLRYFKGLTQEQTARILGVSQVQVSRLERRGLKRLREFLSL
mgnify:CR=1 FL=1